MDHLHRCRPVLGAIASAVRRSVWVGHDRTCSGRVRPATVRPSSSQSGASRAGRAKPAASVHRAQKAGYTIGRIERAAATAAARHLHRRRGRGRDYSRNAGCSFLGRLDDGLHQRTSGAARPLARPLQRWRGRCFWSWPARRLERCGKSPKYSVVTGVSTGALMAPFIFAGPRYDDALRETYTKISAADVFEAGRTAESFVDSWPLKETIAKKVTPRAAGGCRRRASARPPPVRHLI